MAISYLIVVWIRVEVTQNEVMVGPKRLMGLFDGLNAIDFEWKLKWRFSWAVPLGLGLSHVYQNL